MSASQEINSLYWPSLCMYCTWYDTHCQHFQQSMDQSRVWFPVLYVLYLVSYALSALPAEYGSTGGMVPSSVCTVPGIICIVSAFSRVWINRGYGSQFCMYCTWYDTHCQHFQQSMDQPRVWFPVLYVLYLVSYALSALPAEYGWFPVLYVLYLVSYALSALSAEYGSTEGMVPSSVCTVSGIICIVSAFSRVWINRGYGSQFCMYCTWYHMHCQRFQQSMDQPRVSFPVLYVLYLVSYALSALSAEYGSTEGMVPSSVCTVPGIICIVSAFSRVWINRGSVLSTCYHITTSYQ